MDLGSIFLVAALLGLVVLFIGRPFLERKRSSISAHSSEEDHEISYLLAERDRLLDALEELDFDYSLGKIPEDDYPPQRTFLLQRGAEVLRRLDEHGKQNGRDADDKLEAAIAARRAAAGSATNEPIIVDDALEDLLSKRRQARQEKASGFCPQCGRPLHKSDRFCPNCGTAIA